jgi:hypothetical protein
MNAAELSLHGLPVPARGDATRRRDPRAIPADPLSKQSESITNHKRASRHLAVTSEKPTNEMVRRLIPCESRGIVVAASDKEDHHMQIHSVGIDLGKTTFHLVALGAAGKVLVRKKFTQKQLLAFTANMQISLIGLEACSGAHFLGRALRKQGHDVRLIAVQFVRPFVKSNKNDFVDAEAIAEAVERKNMRFVPIKTDDQLDLQATHRVRDRLISRRTAVINQLRAFLLERGMVFAQKPARLKAAMADILENAEAALTPQMRNLIDMLWSEWKLVEQQIEELNDDFGADLCRRRRMHPHPSDSRDRASCSQSYCRRYRQRSRIPQGTGLRCVARDCASSVFDGRQGEAAWHQ